MLGMEASKGASGASGTTDGVATVFAKLEEMTHDFKVAMLTTRAADGSLHSRPMATTGKRFDRTLWFLSAAGSAQCREVAEESDVNVCYADPSRHRYVSVGGRARLVREKAIAEELWTPLARVWFPQGAADPNLILLQVTVEWAEYWQAPSLTPTAILHLAKSLLTRRPFLGEYVEHEKFTLGPSSTPAQPSEGAAPGKAEAQPPAPPGETREAANNPAAEAEPPSDDAPAADTGAESASEAAAGAVAEAQAEAQDRSAEKPGARASQAAQKRSRR